MRTTIAIAALACLVGCTTPAQYLEQTEQDSEAADRAIADGRTGDAEARLRTLIEREAPTSLAEDDVRVIRQDAFDRWARLALGRGDRSTARARVERGLSLGIREDVFSANLLTTRGRIHEAEGRDREAAADYHRALVIEEALLVRALGAGDE